MRSVIIAIAAVLSCGAFAANPLFPDWGAGLHSTTTWSGANCTNFSANWKGSCVDQHGTSSDQSLKIEQSGCDTIKINDFSVPIGGFLSLNAATAPQSDNTSTVAVLSGSLDWNADRSQITSTGSVLVRQLGGAQGTGKQVMNQSYNGSLQLKGDKLEGTLVDADGKAVATCEFSKQ